MEKKIDIRRDCWLASGELITTITNSDLEVVADLIDPVCKCWDTSRIRQNFLPLDAIKILQTPIAWNYNEDTIWWPFSRAGDFSVKTGYFQAKKHEPRKQQGPSSSGRISQKLWELIWRVNVPQKMKHFFWKICQNAIPVGENLWKKKVKKSPICPLCMEENETIEHTLLFCSGTRGVWFGLQLQSVPDRYNITTIHDWLERKFKKFEELKEYKEFAKISLICALWSIWKGRNQAIFEAKNPNPIKVIQKTNIIQQDYFDHWKKISRSTQPQAQPVQVTRIWHPQLGESPR